MSRGTGGVPGGMTGARLTVLFTLAAVGAAIALSAGLIATTGGSPVGSVHALYEGSMADATAWSTTLLNTGPLLLVAVGTCIAARGGVFSIGQEGQVLVGSLGGAFIALRLAVTGPLMVVLILSGAAVAGGAWAALSALMYRLRGVNIVVSTLLMTFLAQQLVSYVVSAPWLLQESRTGSGTVDPQSNQIPLTSRLGSLGKYPGLQISIGLLLALAVAAAAAVALDRSRWGMRLTMLGLNPRTARHAGVRAGAMTTAALTLTGALAGLAGALLLTTPISTNRLQPGISDNIGWDGLLVALVARNQPLIAVPVSLLFGVLRAGGDFLAATGVPPYLVDVVKGLLVLAFVVPPALTTRLRRAPAATPDAEDPTAVPARRPQEASA